MRQTYYYLFFLFGLLLSGCKNDDDSPKEEKYVEATIRLEGEILEKLSTSFASDDEKKDLYGIDVLYADYDETPYAYGLFDDLRLAKVKLLKGKKYIFRIMVVPDGKKLCYDHLYGNYKDIFSRKVENSGGSYGESCPLTNEFNYHKELHFWMFNNPIQSFYYEIYTGYVPEYSAETDNIIAINMKRMFGYIKLKAKNLLHGKLEFQFISDTKFPITRTNYGYPIIYTLTPDNMDTKFTYSLRFWGNGNREMSDNYSFISNYTVRWIDNNGKSTNLGIYPVKSERDTETTVTLDLSQLLKN